MEEEVILSKIIEDARKEANRIIEEALQHRCCLWCASNLLLS